AHQSLALHLVRQTSFNSLHPPPQPHTKETPLFSIKAMVDRPAQLTLPRFPLSLPQEQKAPYLLPPQRHEKPQEQVLSCYQASKGLPLETVPGNGGLPVNLDSQKAGCWKASRSLSLHTRCYNPPWDQRCPPPPLLSP